MSEEKIKVLVVGEEIWEDPCLAYASIPEFEIVAVCTRSEESRAKLMSELPEGTLGVNDYENALNELKPDAVCISTYPDTHYPFAKMALEAGCHVFTEKPLGKIPSSAKNSLTWLNRNRKHWSSGIYSDNIRVGSNLSKLPKLWVSHWL